MEGSDAVGHDNFTVGGNNTNDPINKKTFLRTLLAHWGLQSLYYVHM